MVGAEIFPLNEGYYTIGFDKIFYPFDIDKDILEERSRGSLLVEIQPFLIITTDKNILLDAGLGFDNPDTGNLKIIDNLTKHGLEADDITDVVMSHLHKDHAGGFFYKKEGNLELTFKKAVYHINSNEYNFASDTKNSLSYNTEEIKLLQERATISWFEGGKIFDFIDYEEDGGHCPHHTSMLIHTLKGKYFFGGDVAPQLKQLKFRYIAKYDFDGKRSLELRQEYAAKGKEEDWTFLFYHDVKLPMSKL